METNPERKFRPTGEEIKRIRTVSKSNEKHNKVIPLPENEEDAGLRNLETQAFRRHQFLKDVMLYVCSVDEAVDLYTRDTLKYLRNSSVRGDDFTEHIGDYVGILLSNPRLREILSGWRPHSLFFKPIVVGGTEYRGRHYDEYLTSGCPEDFCIFLAGICNVFSAIAVTKCVATLFFIVRNRAEFLMRKYSDKFRGYEEIQRFAKQRLSGDTTKYSALIAEIFSPLSEQKWNFKIELPDAENLQAVSGENSTSNYDAKTCTPLTLAEESQSTAETCTIVMATDFLSPSLRYRLFLKSVILYVCSHDTELEGSPKERMKKLHEYSARSGDFTDNIGYFALHHLSLLRENFETLKEFIIFSEEESALIQRMCLYTSKAESVAIQRLSFQLHPYWKYARSKVPGDTFKFLAGVCELCSFLAAEGEFEENLILITVIATFMVNPFGNFVHFEELDLLGRRVRNYLQEKLEKR